MYQKPKIFIINKNDMERIKALASSGSGVIGCAASATCTSNVDGGSCITKPGSNRPNY